MRPWQELWSFSFSLLVVLGEATGEFYEEFFFFLLLIMPYPVSQVTGHNLEMPSDEQKLQLSICLIAHQ